MTSPSTPTAGPATVDRAAWRTLFVTSLVGFMVSIEITIISLAFPEIRAAFPDASESLLSWVFTAFNIGLASLLLLAGWLADRYGRRKVFILGLILFGLASLIAGFSQSAEMLVGARVLQSIGGAMQYPAGLALLLNAFPPEKRQMAIGIWGAMGGLAAAAGPTLGALLVEIFGWRAVFLINVPVAAFAVVAGRAWLTESVSDDVPDRVDAISVPLASIGVGAVILGIVQGETWGWGDPRTIASWVIGTALLVVFVVRSQRHPRPLFDLALFKERSYTVGNLGTVFFTVAFFIYLVLLPTYIQSVWGWSVQRTGLAIAPGPLTAMVMSPPMGRLAERVGNGPVLSFGALCGAVGISLHLAFTDTTPDFVTELLIPGIFIGIAAGCSFAGLVGATMRDVHPNRFGMAGAGRTTVFQLAIALGVALGVAIVGRPASSEEALDAIQVSWAVALVGYLLQLALFAFAFPAATNKLR